MEKAPPSMDNGHLDTRAPRLSVQPAYMGGARWALVHGARQLEARGPRWLEIVTVMVCLIAWITIAMATVFPIARTAARTTVAATKRNDINNAL